MRRWEQVARAPSAGGDLVLWRGGDEFKIRVGTIDLMGSREHGSEDELGRLGCEGLRPDARVLVGGLGLGFTLAAALATLGPRASVHVAEANAVIVDWNRAHLGHLAGDPLADPRVTLGIGDVGAAIRAARWDAILLDVDNGPEALSLPENAALYDATGLAIARAYLRPGGRLGVWSVRDDAAFTRRVRGAGFEVAQHRVSAWPGSGRKHVLWLATRP